MEYKDEGHYVDVMRTPYVLNKALWYTVVQPPKQINKEITEDSEVIAFRKVTQNSSLLNLNILPFVHLRVTLSLADLCYLQIVHI